MKSERIRIRSTVGHRRGRPEPGQPHRFQTVVERDSDRLIRGHHGDAMVELEKRQSQIPRQDARVQRLLRTRGEEEVISERCIRRTAGAVRDSVVIRSTWSSRRRGDSGRENVRPPMYSALGNSPPR